MSLQDFQILSRLGEGTYSSVWQAKRLSDGEIYAIKKVKMTSLSEKEVQNSLNEVRLLASINNPYIIGFKEVFFEDNQTLCIVMEFAGGGDVHNSIIKHQKGHTLFKEKDIWRYAVQMITGLKTLHDRKILHRDLKCANIFISKDETIAKLGDLNVSKVAKNNLVYTQTGTPYYASPEVWRDEPYDAKSDIWSLGCVIYEMCALKPPFRAKDMPGLFKKVQKGVFEKIPPQYSNDLNNLISLCLQVSTKKRLSCDQLLEHPLIQKNCSDFFEDNKEFQYSTELLNTIRLPKNVKNLRSLRLKLPKSNYQKNSKSVDFKSGGLKIPIVKNFEVALEHQSQIDNERSSKESSTKEETKSSIRRSIVRDDPVSPKQSVKRSPKQQSPKQSPKQNQNQQHKSQSPREESHKDYLFRMQKEYMDRNKSLKHMEAPKVNLRALLREPKRQDVDVRSRRMKGGHEDSESRSIGLIKQIKAELSQIYPRDRYEEKDLESRRRYMSRKLHEEVDTAMNISEGGSRNYTNLEKVGIEKALENRIDAIDKRAQQLIQKYQQDVGAVRRKEVPRDRASPMLRIKRHSRDAVEKPNISYDVKSTKLGVYEKQNSSPIKKEYPLNREELKSLQPSPSYEHIRNPLERSNLKGSDRPTWWG